MKSRHQSCLASLLLFFFIAPSFGQDQRTFNQNASGGNHGLSISFSPVFSSDMNSKDDSLLFRGRGVGFRFGADYFFGKAGIGFSSGFGSSAPDDALINRFIKRSAFPPDGLIVTRARQQNMYLLLGPSVRFVKIIELYAHAKGGLFINNSGLISIQQKGGQRTLYRNESTSKSIYPGFLTGLGVQYKTKSDLWSFGIGLDYMNTKSEINNYDARRGGGIEALKFSRNITDLVTGITVRYNILSPRDHASGQASGKTHTGNIQYGDIKAARDAGSGLATGRRIYQPGQPVYGNITRQEPANQSCGAVTQTVTNPDGGTEEMTFACPDDAADYNNRISMNVTVPKQTQGATFGEKVNQGLHAAGGALSQGASLIGGVIAGNVSWSNGKSTDIVTNQNFVSSVGNLAGAGGGAAAASYAATRRIVQQPTLPEVVVAHIYAREAGSGLATGRRSRDAGSGQATGRRQYEPVFTEGETDECTSCAVSVKLNAHELTHIVQQSSGHAKENPLYNDNGHQGTNPLFEGKSSLSSTTNNDCDGIAGLDVLLLAKGNGAIIAKTKTTACGDFFFANVPEANYVVKVRGAFSKTKSYDVKINSEGKTDMAGEIVTADDRYTIQINSGNENSDNQKAGISTSRSNIRNKTITIIEADLDGDGEFESTKVLAGLYDGTTKDITAMSRMSNAASIKKVTVRGWDPEKKQAIAGSANAVKEYTITIGDDNGVLLTRQYENGTKEETRVMARVSHHPNVIQFVIPLDDSDNDGTGSGQRVKTKSNIKNDRIADNDMNADGLNTKAKITKSRSNIQNNRVINDEGGDGDNDNGLINAKAKITKSRSNIQNNRTIGNDETDDIWSPRSNIKILKVATGDADGDGKTELLVGGLVPGGTVISAAMSPGEPIPGIDVKLGKNPGGQSLQTTTSNANGEFEFTNLKAGDYTFTIVQKILIDDETAVTMESNNARVQDHNSSRSNKTASIISDDQDNEDEDNNAARKGWDGTVKGGSKTNAQDHNSSRSNKTSGIIADDQDNEEEVDHAARKGWDGTVKGGSKTKAQDHNSSRSNKTSGIIADDQDNEDEDDNAARKGWDGTVKGGNKTNAQDHNSSRSNKTSGIIADDQDNGGDENRKSNLGPVKWMAPESLKRTVNTSRDNIKNLISSLDDLENQLSIDKSSEQKLVNTSRSNIKSQRLTVSALQETLANIEYMDKETAMHEVNRKMLAMNSQFHALQESIAALGGKYASISNILKSRHDVAMNAIRNMK
ncbi:MAG: carboxypeptidase regulatory-like domain-containing protein [Chitinophagaceae bacterium]